MGKRDSESPAPPLSPVYKGLIGSDPTDLIGKFTVRLRMKLVLWSIDRKCTNINSIGTAALMRLFIGTHDECLRVALPDR